MKIGILTYHCVTNFGAQLQCLSTIGYLKKNGHEPIVLNWWPQDLEDFYLSQHPREQYDEQFNFAMNNMPISRLCRTLPELSMEIDRLDLDAIFLGSDALFDYFPKAIRNPFSFRKMRRVPICVTCNHDLPNPFWGSFDDMVKKKVPFCGFSISSQNASFSKLDAEERAELGRLLNKFTLITTRDEWTQKFVETVGDRHDVTVTPDPVFGFNYNTSFEISMESLLEKYGLPENYILVSLGQNQVPDKFINEVIRKVEKATGYACVSFPMPRKLKQYNTQYTINLPLPTLDWYYLIKYSQGYIGSLMHPIIVSLHNSVPFYCFDQYGISRRIIPGVWYEYIDESSKIYDILHRADLLTNVCPLLKLNSITPDTVANNFLKFDREKCSKFASLQYDRYKEGMEKVISSLQH